MTPISIAALREQSGETPLSASVSAQLQSRQRKETKGGKPFLDLQFADSTGALGVKIWSDSPVYQLAEGMEPAQVVRLEARWTQNQYGIDAKDLAIHHLEEAAREQFFAGDPALREKQARDFAVIRQLCDSITDPRLHDLCQAFFEKLGERFCRTAAARKNHHARRGGLVEHVALMMRSADALCGVYEELNRDLLLTGTLFHDVGKLWENSYPKQGFAQSTTMAGELLGHIPLGIEMVNHMWKELLETPEAESWSELQPATETLRLHLLHLIGSHHGEYEFGSPVLPRTPEAFALHYIDNLDAKLEMVRQAYAVAPQSLPGIYERQFPLPANLVKPAEHYAQNPKNTVIE